MLTGKAKIDFYKYLKSKGVEFNPKLYSLDLAELILYSLIIKWLDSVGIYLETSIVNYNKSKAWIYAVDDYDDIEMFDTRQEATQAAIKTANEIYNERN